MINTVSFPGLGLEFTLNRVAITVLGRPIYWYGVIIVTGLILAVYLCSRWGKRFGISEDNILDMMFFAVPAALVAIRAYYVIFNLQMYRRPDGSLDWGAILRYSDGGLAIYGAIISSAIVLFLFCRNRRLSFLAYADLGVHGLFIGQLVGRWGNFMNVEAFGGTTALPWRMCGPSIAAYMADHGYVDEAGYQAILSGTLGVHPTFFYESAWNLAGLIMVYAIGKRRKFDGECFLFYFFWYGLGRAWIEGLRTDSLYLFGWELFGVPIRVSQLFALVTCAAAGGALVYMLLRYRDRRQVLFVERQAEQNTKEE
ncbi:prolipoprotein diacylglyceryl transferase [Oscillospiraceae bacterium 50-16]